MDNRSQKPQDFWTFRLRGCALVLSLAASLYPHFKEIGWRGVYSASVEAPANLRIIQDLHDLYPSFPDQAKILFLKRPVPPGWWNMLFMVRLSYRNDSLQVDGAKRIGRPGDAKLAPYDPVFDYAGGRFFEFRPMGAGSGTVSMAQRER